MAFTQLEFSKVWTNPVDFPTIELEETQVRADMQLLFDEIKDFLNESLIPAAQEDLATKEELDAVVAGISPDLTAAEEVLSQM